MAPRPKDPAWSHVDIDPNKEGIVICKICKTPLSLGKDKKNQSISCMKRHLKGHHHAVWLQIYGEEDVTGTPKRGQKRPADDNPILIFRGIPY